LDENEDPEPDGGLNPEMLKMLQSDIFGNQEPYFDNNGK